MNPVNALWAPQTLELTLFSLVELGAKFLPVCCFQIYFMNAFQGSLQPSGGGSIMGHLISTMSPITQICQVANIQADFVASFYDQCI